ncbi:14966_t:CDS:2 [Racocetra persica]|uniref:14966_t:CDS:1 n=1 Tax=Racocetra persica TaxID=160502 RepID=A0ACA9KJQ0_9GLOM|nr:14966_t:CDS:2 [Racocetra persica]
MLKILLVKGVKHVFLVLTIIGIYHCLGAVLKNIHDLLELIVFKEKLGAYAKHDQIKKDLCEENWIVLREVWYYENLYKVIPDILCELGLIE